jgi:hypothetical protein
MSAKPNPAERVEKRVDDEFAAEHGTTASGKAYEHEAHPEIDPHSPAQLGHKIASEAGEGDGVVEKLKRGLEEIDRDVSGEYERRDDPGAKR